MATKHLCMKLIMLGVLVCYIFYFILQIVSASNQSCPLSGIHSSAPRNVDFDVKLAASLLSLKKHGHQSFLCTTVNKEAAIHNMPPFIASISSISHTLLSTLIVFCLDEYACNMCIEVHSSDRCIFMDLGTSTESLAPGSNTALSDDYWRVTYGRVYATMSVHSHNVNVLAVDVDAVFLQDPFAPGNGIHERPNDIAVVSDTHPFTFSYNDKQGINGGFIYFTDICECESA